MRWIGVVVVTLFACVEYPHYECDTYALSVGADAPWNVACDVTIAGTTQIHAEGVVAAPTFDGSTPRCTIPSETDEPVPCSANDLGALSCTRTCDMLWISSSDPSVKARFVGAVSVHVVCGSQTQDYSSDLVSPACPM
jgi:hypothetical protein